MEKTKLFTIVIIGLLLLNLGTLGFLFMGSLKNRQPPDGGRTVQDKALTFLMNEVQYDEQQRQACGKILQTHRRNMDRIHHSIRENHNIMFDNIAGGDTTTAAVIGDLYRQGEIEVFTYFTALRNVARPDQKDKFDRIIQEAMRIMPPPKDK